MKIYIICPAYVATGGVELIHQFQYKLNMLGFEAYIYFMNVEEGKNPVLSQYKKYNVKRTNKIEDSEDNIIVFPEIYIDYAAQFRKVKKAVWWMSVDFAHGDEAAFQYLWDNKDIMHLVQSQYALDFVKKQGVCDDRIKWLSDYINSEYLHVKKVSSADRGPIVLFNPRKGFDMTAKIIQESRGNIRWIALTGFTPEALRKLMQESKVYIDFGNHPGRDRIPREASMCGCLVITNRKGAAANPVDVLIDDKYKFDESYSTKEIVDTIIKLITEYDDRAEEYTPYIKRTAREFQGFEVDLYRVFCELLGIEIETIEADELKQGMLDDIYESEYEIALRKLVQYKALGYKEDVEIIIIESNIRISLGEIFEAEYLLKEGLINNPDNYEMLLMLAGIHSTFNTKEDLLLCVEECQHALELSSKTPDEDVVNQEVIRYMTSVKNRLADMS